MNDSVSFKEIATRLGVNQSTVMRIVQRAAPKLGITVQKGRNKGRNAMWGDFLSREDTDRLVAYYESEKSRQEDSAAADVFQIFGFFYVIQLVPEALPNRIKIGYTDNLEQRLADHRTSAPTARIIGSWPCKRSWDYAAMDNITREGCTWVLNEVFEGSPEGFVERANAFFAVMPKANDERPLSEHSPLRQK